jgi:radical SAM protein with 4Fe4S-binding SPASM domain
MRTGESTPLPYLVAVNLTRRCNLACAHCYMDAEQRAKPAPGELSDEALGGLFRDLAARAPGTIVVLTGGEPLLHPGLEGLVATGTGLGLRMVLGTNGVLLTAEKAARLKAAGLEGMGISLDSVSAKSHDAFRGMPGAFARSCAAVRLCREAGMHAQIHFTVTRRNKAEIRAAVDMAKGLGAAILNFFFLVCVGRGESRMDLAPDEYENALREIAELQGSGRGILVQTRCTPHFKRVLHQADPRSPYTRAEGYDGGGCLAATHYCRITPKGDVTPCPYIELSAGNLADGGFWKVWEQSRLFQSLRDPELLEGRCGGCEYKYLCGGCRARALVDAGNLMGEDPSCAYVPAGGEPFVSALGDGEDAEAPGAETASESEAAAVPAAGSGAAGGKAGAPVDWTPEARERLARVPLFLRKVVKRKLEERARAEGTPVTAELMARHRSDREKELGLKFN